MSWSDNAILLDVRQAPDRSYVIGLLTERHGRQVNRAVPTDDQVRALLPGATLRVENSGQGKSGLSTMTLSDIKGGITDPDAQSISATVWVAVREMLLSLLPAFAPATTVFQATSELLQTLHDQNNRWALCYFRWEMALLVNLGNITRLEHCRSVFQGGDVIYYSPKNGKLVTREEAGAFLDKVIPVPGFLLGKRDASALELEQAEPVLSHAFETFALDAAALDAMPESRGIVLKRTKGIKAIPKPPPEPMKGLSDDDYRRRLLSLRPLQVVDTSASV